ncbi:DUF3822 family protein [Draconibacterium sediminis]|uniref:DUF3822 domain-containing protein n=1 Tax=Draconibacterium sediminis TaxID=1544798 RepID=A0A0D8J671_9BACT|nr:DUF3822 family protein [Draconibacterium sediminis]KJF42026.1 hypothetical protein LH29_22355 [Draconibacterium sediminis]
MHEFVDETFQPETTGEKILSIQASLNGFSFSIVCPNQRKLLYFKDIALKISNANLLARHFESLFAEETILQNNYHKIFLVYHSRNFTLIPEQFYQDNIDQNITPLLFEQNEQANWMNNKIAGVNGELLFAIPESFQQALNKRLPSAQIIHPLYRIIEQTSISEAAPKLLLLFGTDHFSLALFGQNELKLINNFSFKHPNDVVYFVLTVLRQFGISAKDITVQFAGNTKAHAGLEDVLQKHFSQPALINAEIAVPPFIDKVLITKNISLFL